jgi:hypothetical protein
MLARHGRTHPGEESFFEAAAHPKCFAFLHDLNPGGYKSYAKRLRLRPRNREVRVPHVVPEPTPAKQQNTL